MRYDEIRSILKKKTAGIAGAGGLGSNCAVALARSGVGTLVISDFDRVEAANLNRQVYYSAQVGTLKTIALKENIMNIDPDINVITFEERLNPGNIPRIYKNCDVIVEAFDVAEMKEMLILTVQEYLPGKPLVIGSGIAGWGGTEKISCRKIDDFLYVCGDEATETDEENPPLAPRVGIVANMQANTVLEILLANPVMNREKDEDNVQ